MDLIICYVCNVILNDLAQVLCVFIGGNKTAFTTDKTVYLVFKSIYLLCCIRLLYLQDSAGVK